MKSKFTADDMIRNAMERGDCACSLGWMFRLLPWTEISKCASKYEKIARQMGLEVRRTWGVAEINDCPDNDLEDIAKCLTKAFAACGYEIHEV